MKNKYYVLDSLIIEVTRRCNIRCNHCLRGPQQRKDMDLGYIEKVFKEISDVDCITFSGGEPSLVPEIISGILTLAKKYKVSVNNFYCVTNCTTNSKEFVLSMMEWYLYCTDNETSGVRVSRDQFHKYEVPVYSHKNNLLSALSFVEVDKAKLNYIIAEGRGADCNEVRSRKLDDSFQVRCELDDEGLAREMIRFYDGELYLNVLGEFVDGCDHSYKNQSNFILGDVKEKNWMKNLVDTVAANTMEAY